MQKVKSELKETHHIISLALLDFKHLPDNALIRPPTFQILLGISIATLWRFIKNKKLHAQKLTQRTTTVRVLICVRLWLALCLRIRYTIACHLPFRGNSNKK